ncbi:MAG: TIGR03960 family B12-binding radical SAM protein [Angelakisella sp.]|jgi:radical SAM family uncharacterized protein|nr:TIGR03960 family B12-binding radical SAM protein [Angelakisella sp.]
MIPAKIDRQLLRVQKPARYAGGEMGSVMKNKEEVDLRFAFCFPDLYEVGMSHLGMKILYSLINDQPGMWCERVFAPDTDFEAILRREGIPLYGLESFDPIREFDVIGFTLQYEMCYTTVLNMLDLAGLPVRSADREDLWPLVIGGGPCACNPEPIADFFDLFQLGEGEELMLEMLALCRRAKEEGMTKPQFLRLAAQIPGIYVPSLYDPKYNSDGTIQEVVPKEGAPARVQKRIVKDISKMFFPDDFVVPFTEIVHDRAMVEVLRGCLRGCRFCQAGYIYRPFREKDPAVLDTQARALCGATGYEEVSLTSLSTSDHSRLEGLMERLLPWTTEKKVNIALPSLRVDNFSPRLLEMIQKVRRSGLTFAPEAGSQRLRDAINKNVTEEEVLATARTAFEGGCTSMKLYFMMGLPTETMEDMDAIITLAQKVVDLYYSLPGKPKGRGVQVTISVACFVPKPHTPFQFEPQDTLEAFRAKQRHLLETVTSKKIRVNYHDASTSRIEAILARGDRRLSQVVETVWREGGNLEGWDEHFSVERWNAAMEKAGLWGDFYACRRRPYDEVLPWDHLDYGLTKEFFVRENKKAWESQTTENCRRRCSGCGANYLLGGACFEADASVL